MPPPYKPYHELSIRGQRHAKRQCLDDMNIEDDTSSESDSGEENPDGYERGDRGTMNRQDTEDVERDECNFDQVSSSLVSAEYFSENADDEVDDNIQSMMSIQYSRTGSSNVSSFIQEESELESDPEEYLRNNVFHNRPSDIDSDMESQDDENFNGNINPEQDNADDLLYEGAQITVAESLIATLDLSVRHNISGALLSDILKLIALHCPAENKCKTTLYKFNKYFEKVKSPIVHHFHCLQCMSPVERSDSLCPECTDASKIGYFIEVSVIEQLKILYERPGFIDLLDHRVQREQQNGEGYNDIYDGAVYKKLTQCENLLAFPDNISFTMYFDGIRIFGSSDFSVWPVYLVINELPFAQRTKKENIIVSCLWFGQKKPCPILFLEPLATSLQELRDGIDLRVPHTDVPRRVHGAVICATCDLPAKALFLNMKQFNGRFGCQICKQEGRYLSNDRVRV